MNEQAAAIADDVRLRILEDPEFILEDPDVMRALIAANERAMGDNIVDLRGVAMERLEARLGRLEDTHRSVIAAAYDNLSGMNQVHRAIMAFLEPTEFDAFLACLATTSPTSCNWARSAWFWKATRPSTSQCPDSDVLLSSGRVSSPITSDRAAPCATSRSAARPK